MKGRIFISTAMVGVMMGLALTGCGSSAPAMAEKEKVAETNEKKDEVTTIRFYRIYHSEYNQNIVTGEKENPDVKVEIVPVDFDNAEQVIKTGITSIGG